MAIDVNDEYELREALIHTQDDLLKLYKERDASNAKTQAKIEDMSAHIKRLEDEAKILQDSYKKLYEQNAALKLDRDSLLTKMKDYR